MARTTTESGATTDEGRFTAEERAAMKERAAEARAARSGKAADGEADVLAKIAELPDDEREVAERVHAIVREEAPELAPRTWYGQPAYATPGKAGTVVCFFQPASKFGSRYSTLGFNDPAQLDDGDVWPTAYAIVRLSAADEERLRALVRRAAGSAA